MCSICSEAKKLPKDKALKVIADAMMDRKTSGRACYDETIGLICGEPEPVVDREKEAAWAKGNSWQT